MGSGSFNRSEMIEREERRLAREAEERGAESWRNAGRVVAFLLVLAGAGAAIVYRVEVASFVRRTTGMVPPLDAEYSAALEGLCASIRSTGDAGAFGAEADGDKLVVKVRALAWEAIAADQRRSALSNWHAAFHDLRKQHGLPATYGEWSPLDVRDEWGALRARVHKKGLLVRS